MATRIYCDICGRGCGDDHHLVQMPTGAYVGAGGDGDGRFHICKPRDGMDVGCISFFKAGINEAKDRAHNWLQENRPESLPH